MTKKHFDQAAMIVAAQHQLSVPERQLIALAFVMLFEHNNPRFAKDRFFVACGLATAPPAKRRASPRRLTGDPFSLD
jgi:hypothetical protein